MGFKKMFISFSFFPLFISYCLCNTKLLGRKEKKRIHICSPSLPYLTPHASATLSLPFVSDMSDLYCGSVLCICYPPSLECPWLNTFSAKFFLVLFVIVAVQSLSCDPMDCNTPGYPVFHYFLEFAQIHVH